ncbi:MAG: thiamine phosphate synthase, partial [Pseudomonadota bacterium]
EAACRAMVNRVMPSCHSADVPLVVTDRPGLVAPLGLDGVHLEMLDESIKKIREAIGSDAIIGATGGTGRHRAMTLAEAGADYVTLGPISPDGSAAEGLAGDDLFSWWAEMIETPVVAEGNVDLATAARLKETADFLVPDPALVWSDPATMLVKFAKAIA